MIRLNTISLFLIVAMVLVGLSVGEPGSCQCPEVLRPVCGVDGRDYDNECKAGCHDVEVDCKGKCPCYEDSGPEDCVCPADFQPVCGVDNRDYDNECKANCHNIDVKCKGRCPCKSGDDGEGHKDLCNCCLNPENQPDFCRFVKIDCHHCTCKCCANINAVYDYCLEGQFDCSKCRDEH